MSYKEISVDTVYQKVLAIANKEQRGYITPQDFNLFAKQAQQEIFDNYFSRLKVAHLKPSNQSDSSDEINELNEKLSIHRTVDNTALKESVSEPYIYTTPSNAYNITSVNFTNSKGQLIEITNVDRSKVHYMLLNPLTAPTLSNPVYVRTTGGDIEIYPTNFTSDINVHYIKKPNDPNWGYVIVGGKAMYNSNSSSNFNLHASEENNLVMRILVLSGISIKDEMLTSVVSRDIENTEIKNN